MPLVHVCHKLCWIPFRLALAKEAFQSISLLSSQYMPALTALITCTKNLSLNTQLHIHATLEGQLYCFISLWGTRLWKCRGKHTSKLEKTKYYEKCALLNSRALGGITCCDNAWLSKQRQWVQENRQSCPPFWEALIRIHHHETNYFSCLAPSNYIPLD